MYALPLLGLCFRGLTVKWTRRVCWRLAHKVLACPPSVWDSWVTDGVARRHWADTPVLVLKGIHVFIAIETRFPDSRDVSECPRLTLSRDNIFVANELLRAVCFICYGS